jgi:hypothetical protein
LLLLPEAAEAEKVEQWSRGAAEESTRAEGSNSKYYNSLALSYGQRGGTKRMLARQSQLADESFANCFGVFEFRGK